MKREVLVRVHLSATIIATTTIFLFFVSSCVAELIDEENVIKRVKAWIFYSLPVLILSMPTLAITGKKLAGRSRHPMIINKLRRMKMIMINGILLILLASFLYYRSRHQSLDVIFLYAQLAEMTLGLTNLLLMALNIRAGLTLSGRLRKRQVNHPLPKHSDS